MTKICVCFVITYKQIVKNIHNVQNWLILAHSSDFALNMYGSYDRNYFFNVDMSSYSFLLSYKNIAVTSYQYSTSLNI